MPNQKYIHYKYIFAQDFVGPNAVFSDVFVRLHKTGIRIPIRRFFRPRFGEISFFDVFFLKKDPGKRELFDILDPGSKFIVTLLNKIQL